MESQQRFDVARVSHSLRNPLDRRHQQAVALFGHDVFVFLLASRGHLPCVHQLHALGRRQAVVRDSGQQGQGIQICHGKTHEVTLEGVPRPRYVVYFIQLSCSRALSLVSCSHPLELELEQIFSRPFFSLSCNVTLHALG